MGVGEGCRGCRGDNDVGRAGTSLYSDGWALEW